MFHVHEKIKIAAFRRCCIEERGSISGWPAWSNSIWRSDSYEEIIKTQEYADDGSFGDSCGIVYFSAYIKHDQAEYDDAGSGNFYFE